MTLEKRIELHERSRDIAEQNVDKELEGLNDALKVNVFIFPHWIIWQLQKVIPFHADIAQWRTLS